MKTLKIKLGLFSLLAILAVSVLLTSCEQQETIVFDTIEYNQSNESLSTDNTESVIFTLPERFDNMSEEDLTAFFNNTSEEDILALSTIVSLQQIGDRCDYYCGSWSYNGSNCLTAYWGKKWRHRYRRHCTNGHDGYYQYKYVWGSSCP